MRIIILFFISLLTIQYSCAFNDYAILSGRVKNVHQKEITVVVYKDASSGLEYVFNAPIDPDGNFKTFVDIEFPVIGYIKLGQQGAPLYLQPDDSIFLQIDESDFNQSIIYSGKGAANLNMYMSYFRLTELSKKGEQQARNFNSVTDEEFIHISDSFVRSNQHLIDSLKKVYQPESEFYSYLKNEMYYRNAEQVISFPLMKNFMTKQNRPPTYSKFFVDYISNQNLKDESLSRHPDYIKFLNSTLTYDVIVSLQSNEFLTTEELYSRKYKFILKNIVPRRLQLALMGALVSDAIESNHLNYVQKIYEEFNKESADIVLLNALKDKMKQVGFVDNSEQAMNFTLNDINGKKVSLNDFKGKLIYLDFWATWCNPCMMEMPFSIELQKKFAKGKNIVFLFVSIDDDEQKWKYVVKERNITGVHLISPRSTTNILKQYQLTSIPRHYIIGKDGKILDSNASGPSDRNTEILIRKYLN